MVSGDRQVSIDERGPFHSMQREFSRYFERIDVVCPQPPKPPTVSCIHENVFFHPASCDRAGMIRYITERGRAAGENLAALMTAQGRDRAILLLGGAHVRSAVAALEAAGIAVTVFKPASYDATPARR